MARTCETCGAELGQFASAQIKVCRKCRNKTCQPRAVPEPTSSECSRCDGVLHAGAKRGLCKACLKSDAAVRREQRARKCAQCGKPLGGTTLGDLCLACYRESPAWKEDQRFGGFRFGDPSE